MLIIWDNKWIAVRVKVRTLTLEQYKIKNCGKNIHLTVYMCVHGIIIIAIVLIIIITYQGVFQVWLWFFLLYCDK